MKMKFDAEAARSAVRAYEELERIRLERAAEGMVSDIEAVIARKATTEGKRKYEIHTDSPGIAYRACEILRDNGFTVSYEGDSIIEISI